MKIKNLSISFNIYTFLCHILIIILIILSVEGCSENKYEQSERKLSTRERDSILAESPLPGSKVVGKAISVSDSLEARAKRIDSKVKKIDED